jgi:hypothetical protein
MKSLVLSGSLDNVLIYRIPLNNLPGMVKVENSGPEITARVQVTIRNIVVFPITRYCWISHERKYLQI